MWRKGQYIIEVGMGVHYMTRYEDDDMSVACEWCMWVAYDDMSVAHMIYIGSKWWYISSMRMVYLGSKWWYMEVANDDMPVAYDDMLVAYVWISEQLIPVRAVAAYRRSGMNELGL